MKLFEILAIVVAAMMTIVLGQPVQSHARKCAGWDVHISGKVVDGRTKMPVEAAQVIVFVDGENVCFKKYSSDKDPGYIATSPHGFYTGAFSVSNTNIFWGIMLCNHIPDHFEIEVKKDGYRTFKGDLEAKRAPENASFKPYEYTITPPDIALLPL